MQEINPSKIGIFGGSFNPVHIGHLIIANFFVEEFKLDYCYFVPNFISPFKTGDYELIPAHNRLEMLKIAIEDNPKFKVDSFEVDKGGISYTSETIQYFQQKFPYSKLFLLIGSDQAEKFTQWRNWETIVNATYLVIARRTYNSFEPLSSNIPSSFHSRIFSLRNPLIEISSSNIREYIKKGFSIKYLVPEKVYYYITKNNFF